MTWAASPPVGSCRLQPPSPFIIITQPEGWYSFTVPRRVEGWVDLGTAGKVHTARAQGCKSQQLCDKHNCPQRDLIPRPHALQSGILPLDLCDLHSSTQTHRHWHTLVNIHTNTYLDTLRFQHRTLSPTHTRTPTTTQTPSRTQTPSWTRILIQTPTRTRTCTSSQTRTFTPSQIQTFTLSQTRTCTPCRTQTCTPSPSQSTSPSPTRSTSLSPTWSTSPSPTWSTSPSLTRSRSPTRTRTCTLESDSDSDSRH